MTIVAYAKCSCACHYPNFRVAHVAPCCDEETAAETEAFWRAKESEGHRDG